MLTTDATHLGILMNCNGSRLMPPALPALANDPTARDEGNAAHWMAQQAFNGADINALVDTKANNGFTMTGEMADHVVSYLIELHCGEMEVETSFGGDLWRVNARCDHRAFVPQTNTLYIDDFKYGWGIIEPYMNWTLIAHAIGTCIFKQITPDVIVLRIHQPRPHHQDGKVREWRITYPELMDFYRQIAETLSDPSDELRTGLSWCRKCPALAKCPAARKADMNAIDAATMAFSDELPNDALSFELDTLRLAAATIGARLSALEELATYRIKNGDVVASYGLEAQYAHTRWRTGITPQALTIASGIDCTKPGAITPAEAKRRGMPEHVIKTMTERPMTGTKLVRRDVDAHARKHLAK